MGFFDRLLRRSGSDSHSYTFAENELLDDVSRGRTSAWRWAMEGRNMGEREKAIRRFVNAGLLREATPAEKIDDVYRVVDIKALLGQHGVKARGKKADLIAALAGVLTPGEVAQLVGNVTTYRATELGNRHIEAFREEARLAWEATESDALACLLRGDVKGAGTRLARHRPEQQSQSAGIRIDWSGETTWSPAISEVEYLLNLKYEDLPLTKDQRREVGARLAWAKMVGSRDAGTSLLHVTGGEFHCQPLEAFLRDNPTGGYAARHDPDSPRDLAELYAHTRLAEAYAAVELAELIEVKLGKGVTIETLHGDCKLCDRGKHNYRWSEIRDIPKLPRHWGCRCMYAIWQ